MDSKIIHQWFYTYISTSKQYKNISFKDVIDFARRIEKRESYMGKISWASDAHLNMLAAGLICKSADPELFNLIVNYSSNISPFIFLSPFKILDSMEKNIFLDKFDDLEYDGLHEMWGLYDYKKMAFMFPLDISDANIITPKETRDRIRHHIKKGDVSIVKMLMEHGNKNPWDNKTLIYLAKIAKDYNQKELSIYLETFKNPKKSNKQRILDSIIYYKVPDNTNKKRKRSK